MKVNEDVLRNKVDQEAEMFLKKFPSQMRAFQESSLIKKVRSITAYDIYALGKMLESYSALQEMCEADGSVADLGILPKIALDVITVSYGTSPISVVASVQPIDEEVGNVYYKDVVAMDTAGNVTAGEKLFGAESGVSKVPSGYAGAEITEALGNTADGTLTYAGNVGKTPIRPYAVNFQIAGISIVLEDNGNGQLVGAGGYGTINYLTGAYSITLISNPGAGNAITAVYSVNVEKASDINRINYELQAKPVRAKIYALKGTMGLFKAYQLKKRFGTVAEDEIALDLVNAINSEIMGDLVLKMIAGAQGNTDWSKNAPVNVSYFEHKQSYKDTLADAEGVMVSNAKRGTTSFIIAGVNHCAVMQTLPGWTKVYDGNQISGAHLFGTLDGIPVVRVPVGTLMSSDTAILGFKGLSAFEAAAAYSPYMPLTVTALLPTTNPLLSQKAGAVWAGVDVLVKNFLTKVTMTH